MAAVITTFMGGLAVGSFFGGRYVDKHSNPLKLYGLIEIGIGLTAGIVVLALAYAHPLFKIFYNMSPLAFSAFRFVFAIATMIIPAFLMGATYPAIVRFLARNEDKTGVFAGIMYGVNSLGAAAGSILCGFFLIENFGISMTSALAAMLNILVGVLCIVVSRNEPAATPIPRPFQNSGYSNGVKLALITVLVSGLAMMVFQLAATRIISIHLGSTTYSFAMIVSAYILVLSAGGFLGAFVVKKEINPKFLLAVCCFFGSLGIFISSAELESFPYAVLQNIFESHGDSVAVYSFAYYRVLLILTVPVLASGAMIPIAIQICKSEISGTGRTVGVVYAFNTVGAILGTLIAGFFLIPANGFILPLDTACLLMLLMFLVISIGMPELRMPKFFPKSAAVMLSVLALATYIALAPLGIESFAMTPFANNYRPPPGVSLEDFVRETRKNIIENLPEFVAFDKHGLAAVYRKQVAPDSPPTILLTINGRFNATNAADMKTQVMVGQVPMLLHPDPKRVLVVGLGSGITVGSVLTHNSVERLDCIELSRAVVDASHEFDGWNGRPLEDKRTNLVVDDARPFILYSENKYDVVISEPSNLWIAGMSTLYSVEILKATYECMNDGGILCVWAHAYGITDEDFKSMAATVDSVFHTTSLWFSAILGDYLLVATKNAAKISGSALAEKFQQPAVRADLARVHIQHPQDFVFHHLAGHEALAVWTEGARVETDDAPKIEFSAARSIVRFQFLESTPSAIAAESPPAMVEIPQELWSQIAAERNLYLRYAFNIGASDRISLMEAFSHVRLTLPAEKYKAIANDTFARAMALSSERRYSTAIRLLEAIPKNSPPYPRARLALASIWQDECCDLAEAEKILLDLLSQEHGKVLPAYLRLGKIYAFKSPEKAVPILDEAERKFPGNSDLHVVRALVLRNTNKKEEALEILRAVIKKEPDNSLALQMMNDMEKPK